MQGWRSQLHRASSKSETKMVNQLFMMAAVNGFSHYWSWGCHSELTSVHCTCHVEIAISVSWTWLVGGGGDYNILYNLICTQSLWITNTLSKYFFFRIGIGLAFSQDYFFYPRMTWIWVYGQVVVNNAAPTPLSTFLLMQWHLLWCRDHQAYYMVTLELLRLQGNPNQWQIEGGVWGVLAPP